MPSQIKHNARNESGLAWGSRRFPREFFPTVRRRASTRQVVAASLCLPCDTAPKAFARRPPWLQRVPVQRRQCYQWNGVVDAFMLNA